MAPAPQCPPRDDGPQSSNTRMSEHRVDSIRRALAAALAPARLEIVDESHLHAGHAGAREGKGHFRILVVAECFRGLAPIKRHRKVYAALAALLETDIHALGIDARTPDE
jgi:BolA family transcriptional regulator, general stress-responsive regulator